MSMRPVLELVAVLVLQLFVGLVYPLLSQETDSYIVPDEELPEFTAAIPNITIPVGRDAQIPCNIESLGSYKAAWLRVEDKGILTIHDHIITRNYRISLIHSENKQFVLLIKNVQEMDRGGYMCQINTVPMKSQVGYLDVVFPPEILVDETSSDIVANEGSNVSLTCRAKGYPAPQIQWKREDKKDIPLQTFAGKKYVVTNITGEVLTILRVTRVHMGAYLCIAANGILPSVSRRVFLSVHFPPAVWVPIQSLGAPLGNDITFNCHVEAYPSSVNYWILSNGEIIDNNEKYQVVKETRDFKTQLILTIRSLEKADFGIYTCLSKNTLGVQEGNVKLHEIPGRLRTGSSNKRRQYKDNWQQKDTNSFDQKEGSFASKSQISQNLETFAESSHKGKGHKCSDSGLQINVLFSFLTTLLLSL